MAGCFNPNSMEEFMVSADASLKRFETNFDMICSKYGQAFPDDDIVSMKTGEIVNDKGTIRRLKPVSFGGAKLAVTKRRADKFTKALSHSTTDLSQSQPGDAQSIYSSYVSPRVNVTHFADDASKLLSFICEDENEPSDAETISSGDTSSVDNEAEDRSTDPESYSDEVDGDLDLCTPKPRYPCKPKQDVLRFNDNVWYSLGSASNQSPSSGSDLSVRKNFGSRNSRSQEVSSKTEDSFSTEGDQKGACGNLSKSNVARFHMMKGQPEDSGFESGPGIRMGTDDTRDKAPLRLFCLNEDKINRVMSWVKDQANESRHLGARTQPVRLKDGFESNLPTQADDVHLKSPTKIRKKSEKDHNFNNQSSLQNPPPYPLTKPIGDMNQTYTVPLPNGNNPYRMPFMDVNRGTCKQPDPPPCNQHKTWSAYAGPVASSKSTNVGRIYDSSELLETSQELKTDAMCQRRIVRARKRTFIPIQPSYTSEQLLDYLTSPMPQTIVEILSPARPSSLEVEEETLPCLKSPPPSLLPPRTDDSLYGWEHSQIQHSPSNHRHTHMKGYSKQENNIGRAVDMNGHYPMNNLNKNDATESSGSYDDDDVVITKVKIEPGLEAVTSHTQPWEHAEQREHPQPWEHAEPREHPQPREHAEPRENPQPWEHAEPREHAQPRGHAQQREHVPCEMRNKYWLEDRVSVKDDAVTLCEGFGYSIPEYGHIMTPVPQAIISHNVGRNIGTPVTIEHSNNRIMRTPNGTLNALVTYGDDQNLGTPKSFISQDTNRSPGRTPDALPITVTHGDNRNPGRTPDALPITVTHGDNRNSGRTPDALPITITHGDNRNPGRTPDALPITVTHGDNRYPGGTPDALPITVTHCDNRTLNGTPQTCFSAGSRNKKQIFDHLKQTGSQSDSKVITEKGLSRGRVKARRQLTMEQTGRGDPQHQLCSDGGQVLDKEQPTARPRKSQMQPRVVGTNSGRNNTNKFSVDGKSYETLAKVSSKHRQSDDAWADLTSAGEGRVGKNYQVGCSAARGRNVALQLNGSEQETVGRHRHRSDRMDETPASPGRKDGAGMCKNPKISSRKCQPDNHVMSPLRNGRCSAASSVGLSPSSHLSQLQLNSPTRAKTERPKSDKTYSKELFKTPKGSPRPKCAKHPSQITNDLSSKTPYQCKDFSQNIFSSKNKTSTDKSNHMSHKSSSYNDICISSRNHVSSLSPSKSDSDNFRRSMPQLPTSPCLHPSEKQKTSSNEYLVSKENFNKSPYSKNISSKASKKPVFLVPDSSNIRSLKSVKSSKSITSELNSRTVNTGLKKISRDQFRSVYRTADKNPLWTSTPSKARSMPVLNQTMSTILLGEDDDGASDEDNDDDEVETVSPYSFRSESVIGM